MPLTFVGRMLRSTAVRLRVLTYNIQFGRGIDRRIDIERIADMVASFDPDILALQEVDVNHERSGNIDQAATIAKKLGLELAFGATIDRGHQRFGNATLTRLPIREIRHVALPRYQHPRATPRAALVTRLSWNGFDLSMINAHLSVLFRERPAQAAALARELDGSHAVVAGDWNCTPWSPAFRTIRRQLHSHASHRSFPSQLPIVPIDHIGVRGPLRIVRSGTWRGPHPTASDHLPVFAEVEQSS
jgi:endonuclease/exonuclease/phosphatase family metal-dependent hydrolase